MKTTIFVILLIVLLSGCTNYPLVSREDSLVGIEPFNINNDLYPSRLHSSEFEAPRRLEGPINTGGAEDSPFIPIDSDDFYFFFTPDALIPVEKQVFDGVTGLYVSKMIDNEFSEPKRVILQDKNKLSLDGCEFVVNDKIWFCAAREGYTGMNWFTAEFNKDKFRDWKYVEFPEEAKVGELHIHENMLYFHSNREGSLGENDIWSMELVNGKWENLTNIKNVNTPSDDSRPYISSDGQELWITRTFYGSPAVFRSKLVNGEWSTPELIVSQFAGEPTLDKNGNLYFVHHYLIDGVIQEADIYVAYRK